ncbi:response regulator transcription factor [Nocardioides sp. TRM66260-LWL]|uniref:response regulator transcription factor n=1 Tax=Nocardioides sp. TRM66260-LWL TaxID=2874478 RepID=UPI001CC6BBA6|nr:response regulator transcription factor [Nocardioides sp. TRM66260-LWL]MBZ5734097.1 response regulator transcription factor [Nocardioides sp. TRM66260-LWL]
MRVLVVEDDVRLAAVLAQTIAEVGWQPTVEHDGLVAIDRLLGGEEPDVVLLDRMLPGLDGAGVLRRLRGAGVRVPVLMLTARGEVADRISGLDAGADDYLVKPFDLDELLARLRALHRRSIADADDEALEVRGLRLDPAARTVRRDGREIRLSTREFDILHLLLREAGRVVSRFRILDEVWDGETDLRSNVIDVHLATIRAKIDRPFGTDTIVTVRGAGYRVEVDR